jgi:hypothetical protein
MNRLGSWIFDWIRSLVKFRTFSQADGVSVLFGHSSKASTTRYVGTCPGIEHTLKKVPATIGVVNGLREKGGQQTLDIVFGNILEVKVVVRGQG